MSQLDGKWLKDDTVKQNHIRLDNQAYLRGRNAADNGDVDILRVDNFDNLWIAARPTYPAGGGAYTPLSGDELTTRDYVLNVLAGLRDPKDACRVASTANIDLATGGLLIIDGVSLSAGDRVLVKNQTLPAENGIYDAAAGGWARSSDANASNEVTSGMSVLITEGTNNARKLYVLTTSDPITLNTTALSFAQAPNPANFLIPQELSATISAGDITNGYIDLAHLAESESVMVTPLGGPEQQHGVDFTVSTAGSVSRITWAGDLASRIAASDVLLIRYSYATS